MHALLIAKEFDLSSKIMLGMLLGVLVYIILFNAFKMIEIVYVLKAKKPLYNHVYFRLRRLNQV